MGKMRIRDPVWKKFGSGINTPDPQHWWIRYLLIFDLNCRSSCFFLSSSRRMVSRSRSSSTLSFSFTMSASSRSTPQHNTNRSFNTTNPSLNQQNHNLYRVAAIFPEHFQTFTVALKIFFFYQFFFPQTVSAVCWSINKNKKDTFQKRCINRKLQEPW